MNRAILQFLNYFSGLGSILAVIFLGFELSFGLSGETPDLFRQIHFVCLGYFTLDSFMRLLFEKRRIYWVLYLFTGLIVFLPILGAVFSFLSFLDHYLLSQLSLVIILLSRHDHLMALFEKLRFNPAQTIILSFSFFIFIGTVLLILPISLAPGKTISFVDALFTITSATCVTGLMTVDAGTMFSRFGHTVIMLWIQVGGLGIMTFSVLFALFVGRKLSMSESLNLQESYNSNTLKDLFRIIKSVFVFTFIFEAIGAVLLFLSWHKDFPSISDGIYVSVFHSIAAFCNAGISTFSTNLVGYYANSGVILTISFLIILGGIGFAVIYDLSRRRFNVRDWRLLRIESRFAIVISLLLIGIGTVLFYVLERHHAPQGFSLYYQWLIAFFHSVSARTAGFNSIDMGLITPASQFLLIVLMFIGASPGSTGGGVKTTTFGLVMLGIWNDIRGRDTIHLFGRTITKENVQRATTIFMVSLIIVISFFLLLLITEEANPLVLLFETVSAFGTVGYSINFSPHLSVIGKLLIISLMLIGRVGSLTLAFALASQKPQSMYTYPVERIPIS